MGDCICSNPTLDSSLCSIHGTNAQLVPDHQEGVPSVQDAVITDIELRKAVGLERYGTLLQPHNGRDALQDAYEEAIDLAMYLKQVILERESLR
jgi:hypothetical protein